MNARKLFFAGLVATLPVAGLSHGSAILMAFGSTPYSGTESPGNEDGLVTGTTWNVLASDSSSFVDENGVAVTDLTADFGTGNNAAVDYSQATRAAAWSGNQPYPLWDTGLGQDNVVRDTGGLIGVALEIDGLAPGVYDFYLSAFRGDGVDNPGRDYDVRWDVSGSAITDFSSIAATTLTNASPTSVSTWNPGENYATGQFTIDGTNTALYLHVESDSFIGVMNSLEIVPVPEPGTLALLGLGGAMTLLRRRSQA
ncbi:MAG: PEP-CTERM sorting domain-containing protein [Planctomycetota bacterium]